MGLPCLMILEKRVVAAHSGLCREAHFEFVSFLALNPPSPLAFLITPFRKAFYTSRSSLIALGVILISKMMDLKLLLDAPLRKINSPILCFSPLLQYLE